MNGLDQQLFTVEEALTRLGQNKQQGCLIVSKGTELIPIYVKNGIVLSAIAGLKQGRQALDHAVHLVDASHQWIRNAQPSDPQTNDNLSIQEFLLTNGILYKDKLAETGKLRGKSAQPVGEAKHRYFLVPEDQPTIKHFLTRSATVLGRNASSDLVIDDTNVSGRHCILDIQSRGLFVLDLDSTNGTYVNGLLIRDGFINHGDVIELGSYRMTINRELRE